MVFDIHYWKERAERAEAQAERLREMLDSRPAINAGLPETYVEWSQGVYLADLKQGELND